jgi:hypothetical protein
MGLNTPNTGKDDNKQATDKTLSSNFLFTVLNV